jgi:hypothetical protein
VGAAGGSVALTKARRIIIWFAESAVAFGAIRPQGHKTGWRRKAQCPATEGSEVERRVSLPIGDIWPPLPRPGACGAMLSLPRPATIRYHRRSACMRRRATPSSRAPTPTPTRPPAASSVLPASMIHAVMRRRGTLRQEAETGELMLDLPAADVKKVGAGDTARQLQRDAKRTSAQTRSMTS